MPVETLISLLSTYPCDTAKPYGIVVDDPLKPSDAVVASIRNAVNERLANTINKYSDDQTDVILVGMRLHGWDTTNHVLATSDDWKHLVIPTLYIRNGKEYSLWPFKHTVQHLSMIKKACPDVFFWQYQQGRAPIIIDDPVVPAEPEVKFGKAYMQTHYPSS